MAEPSAAASWQAAASERDVLLATKLHVPGVRPDLVDRPRLTERVDEDLRRGLVLVCAPAGYGKTVLLAGWTQRAQSPAAWLSLDAADNDPARFWRHAVAALDRACPGIADRVGPLLGPPAPASFEPLVTALINELADRPDGDQVLLVLDDYHLIGAQAVHASVDFLLEHRPETLQLIVASRSDPPLALARLGPAASWPRYAPRICGSRPARRPRCCGAWPPSPKWPCPTQPRRRWPHGPRDGRPGCSWPRCHCAGSRM